ncbi:unnamed protein product [Rotaria sp. Silwood1]|nr:unnamed protein product [Rotaria sp. Silwood1]CAF3412274.1 unnamed protein product [Rotaria sp. Silwood1]CAF3439439.1 unnamed protein product [Rotaria sp. Silwood1]CAF4835583.1 unnamed protein product [Rotaria sp. Silwood1]
MQNNIPIIVWLDSNSTDSASSFLSKLRNYQYVQIFTEVHACLSYINSHLEQTIILITSGSFALQIVPLIYDSANVLITFVFCASIKTYTNWAMDYCDKLMMFDHEDDLLQRLWLQIEEYLREQAKQCLKIADECKERAQQLKQPCG